MHASVPYQVDIGDYDTKILSLFFFLPITSHESFFLFLLFDYVYFDFNHMSRQNIQYY